MISLLNKTRFGMIPNKLVNTMKTKLMFSTLIGLLMSLSLFAQFTITLPESTNLPCAEFPFVPVCIPISIDVHNELFSDLNAFSATLTNPNGGIVQQVSQSTSNNTDTFGDVSFNICDPFLAPGTYTLCVTAIDRRWWGKDKRVSACMTINVGDAEFLHDSFQDHYCDGEVFKWCPGDWGIEAMGTQYFFGQDVTIDASGCVSFEVDAGNKKNYTIPVLAIVCGFESFMDLEISVGGCDDDFNGDGNGDTKDSDTKNTETKDTSLGLRQVQVIEFAVFPNPATDILNIGSDVSKYQIQIFDTMGRLKKDVELSYDAHINVSDLSPGMYYLIMNDGKTSSSKKILIQ